MNEDLLVNIPEFPTLERLSHIPVTSDLSSVVLYKEAFTDFERGVISDNSSDLLRENMPTHWLEEDWPDPNSAPYICSVFSDKLPSLSDISNFSIYGGHITIVGGGSCLLNSKYGKHIDSNKVVCRLNHPFITEHSEDIGTKTTIHLFNERRIYDYTRDITRDDFQLLGVLNIAIGTTNETAALLEYARYLDSGGDPSAMLVLKPSFRACLSSLHSTKKPSIGYAAAAFGIRVFGGVTLYGFDLGKSRRHYHGSERLHSSHDPEFEAAEFIHCAKSLHNFDIVS